MTESPTGFSRFALVNGLVLERGMVSPLFAETDKKSGAENKELFCELEHPLVLVVADKIKDVKEIVPILDMAKKTKRALFVVSEDLQQDPMSTMIYNNQKDIV
jgi:chaperonin GroEL